MNRFAMEFDDRSPKHAFTQNDLDLYFCNDHRTYVINSRPLYGDLLHQRRHHFPR
jgi:hypothetical protein